jgi:predicted Zn-dependent protease
MAGPIGPEEVRQVADAALGVRGVDGVEVLFVHEWGGLTRFASSAIHQSTWKEDTAVRVRVVSGDRIGISATNAFDEEGARAAAERAREMATVAAPDPHFPGLAPPAAPPAKEGAFDEATASASPAARSEAVATLIAQTDGMSASGAYETTAVEVAVANTEGQFAWAPQTQASLSTVVNADEGGTGFAEGFAPRAGDLDPSDVGRRAADKARSSRGPRDVEPGTYEVVLEPAATSTLVAFLTFLGFGGRAILEGRSCLSGKEGRTVAAPTVSIWDDALSPETLGLPFDFEGTPRRRVDLIRDGVFLGGVHDRRSAKLAGTESTGHGLPPPNPEGAFPLNVFMAPGDATVDEMVAATTRGILITRFHYSNVVHPIESVITGMTRDGTWMIEDGEIAYPIKNLRFTQSILDALSTTSMIGRETALASEFFFSASRVPALKIDAFHFSGRSDH